MADKQDKDLQKVKDLIDLMKANDLVEIEIAEGDSKIHLKRPCAETRFVQYSPTAPMHAAPVPAAVGTSDPSATTGDTGLLIIKSPIVGTFYQASNPESPAFIKLGDKVNSESVVCIIEAMKVMNEIKAELGGTIVEICCKDGQTVEFGQALFKVRP